MHTMILVHFHTWLKVKKTKSQDQSLQWENLNLDTYLHFLGILHSTEVVEIHGSCTMYLNDEGNDVTLDKSMIKSFHHKLKGKIKIIWKPKPVGNIIKSLPDTTTNIVLNMEFYEWKDRMAPKERVKEQLQQ